jgi:hypothetical protein
MPRRAAEKGTPESKFLKDVKASDPCACKAPAMIVVTTVHRKRMMLTRSRGEWGLALGGGARGERPFPEAGALDG